MGSHESAVPAAPAAPSTSAATVWRWLEREAGSVYLFSAAFVASLLTLPHQLLLDGWLALVSGREVVTNGLPAADTLTVWTQGVEWIDQQWLAQALLFVLAAAGGIKLVMLGHVALVAITVGTALLAARRLGGSPRSVARAGMAGALVAPWAVQMRTQTLAMPLFVLLLWLLAADSRAASRRVYLAFPLLVLWANLHGTVVVAALFVSLRGATYAASQLRRRPRSPLWLPRSLALLIGPFACVFASPYGLDLVDYYRSLFLNPTIRTIAPEWGAPTPSAFTVVFYVVAGLTLWLLVRRRRRLTPFEQLALLATMAAAATAIRSLMWFGLAVMLFLPLLLDDEPVRHSGGRGLRLRLAAVLALVVASAASTAAQPASWYTSSWPASAVERVGQLAAERPQAHIFSDGRFGSWLIWERPQLAGRISHDVRWELYSTAQLESLLRIDEGRGGWRATLAAYDVLVLDRRTHQDVIDVFVADPRFEAAWRDDGLVVLTRR